MRHRCRDGLATIVGLVLCVCAYAGPCDNPTLISPNGLVEGALSPGDCTVAAFGFNSNNDSFVDLYRLRLLNAGSLTARMTSTDFDSYLAVTDGSGQNVIAFDDDSGGGLHAQLTRSLVAGTYLIGASTYEDGAVGSASGTYSLGLTCPGCLSDVTGLVSAVLPTSRSVQVGQTATVFATILNAGAFPGTHCRIAPLTPLAANFFYQTTDPLTNVLTGVANTPVTVGPAGQSFVIGLTPSAPIAPTDIQLQYVCDNSNPAQIVSGLNTLRFSASATPVPDIIALAATLGNSGVVDMPEDGYGFFAVATINIGVAGDVNVTAQVGDSSAPATQILLCQTDAQGACLNPPTGPTLSMTIGAGATPTFAVFVRSVSDVPFDPANNRIFVIIDQNSQTRGSTSVALRGGGTAPPASGWVPGSFLPANSFVAQCAVPRSGIDPGTGQPYPDVAGSPLAEKNWLRSWSNDLYLWYSEIADRNPAPYSTLDYFDLLKTNAQTSSGRAKDRFHFHLPTSEWEAMSQSGVEVGYGVAWSLVSATPPRQIVVAYTQAGTPATSAAVNLTRGAVVLRVDNIDAVNDATQAGIDLLNEAVFPDQAGATHTFTIRDPGSATTRVVTMTSVNVTSQPVQNVRTIATASGNVGYLLFNDHIATAEQALIGAITQLSAAGIADLVLDLRYNSGGYLDIASEVGYMIAGNSRTAGKTFERLQFNDKHTTVDPFTGAPLVPLPFHATALGFSAPAGQGLPTLNLPRVYVLTGSNTCSASEAIINSLRGIDINVIQIGSTTCGKPYGFVPQDNCGTTYFSIEFVGVNAKGFGDYPDGFSPANTTSNVGVSVTGCSVSDDFTHALGDPLERRLAAALAYRQTGQCPAATGVAPVGAAALSTGPPVDGEVHKSQWQQNRIMRR